MPRVTIALCLVLELAMASHAGAARWDLSPTFPWSYSVNGTEAATALSVSHLDSVWVAGNATNRFDSNSGRDVFAIYYSRTQTTVAWSGTNTAKPLSATLYDREGLDEGPPAMAVMVHSFGWASAEPEIYLAFTTSGEGVGELTTLRFRGEFDSGSTPWHENARGKPCSAAGISVTGSGTPFSVGWTTANGVDQLFYVRQIRRDSAGGQFAPRVSATLWTGSPTLSITGRAIVADGDGSAWIAAASGGDIVLMKYGPGYWEDTLATELFADPAAGWPVRIVTPGWDEPWAAARDVTGAMWIAGSIDADAAVWKFDENGNPAAGFPVRFSRGPAASFRAIVLDAARNCYVTGSSGGDAVVMGYDAAGGTLAGMPITVTAGADSIGGRGIGLDSYGALWTASTVTAAPATWGGTRVDIRRWTFTGDPPPVAPGEVKVRGPGGAVLNLARNERITVQAWPTGGGSVWVEVRNLRGELIRKLDDRGTGRAFTTLEWDGTNAAGQYVASGTYALLVTGGGLKVMKRVVVVRRP